MAGVDAREVAKLLVEFGLRIALAGRDYFRSRAYQHAAERIAALTEPLDRMVAENRLREIPGVGDAIAAIVAELQRTGTHPSLERMRQDAPESVLDLLSIPGLKPEKVNILYRELGITSLAELERAARDDRLRNVKGIGAALQRKILQGIELREKTAGARHVHRAAELVEAAIADLQRSELQFTRVVPAGDLRRGGELVCDLAVVAETDQVKTPKVVREGELTVHLTDPPHFGAALLHATGSAEHVRQLGELAEAKGLTLTPAGLRRGSKIMASSRSESDIYGALDLPFIEPEMREGAGEIALAQNGALPTLVTAQDIKGILHAHTDASDGVATVMAEAARQRGYSYIGVTDHSRSAHYAGGLAVEEIEAQHAEIDRLNATFEGSFRIFKGIESDILPDGSLAYPDEVLRRFDFIIGSVHSQFRMDREAQTDRVLRAIANPFVDMVGHLTGRQLLRRPGMNSISSASWPRAPTTVWPSRSMATLGVSTWIGGGTGLGLSSAACSA